VTVTEPDPYYMKWGEFAAFALQEILCNGTFLNENEIKEDLNPLLT